jgi:hypothetical protein
MQAVARLNPFDPNGFSRFDWTPGQSLAAIVREAGLPDWFLQHGEIRVARHGKWVRYEPSLWPHVKPKQDTFLELRATVHGGKGGKLFIALAAVALTVATAGIGAGALAGTLGAGFGAGTVGASLAATGAGIAGQLALKALTPSPSAGGQPSAIGNDLKQAGVSVNGIQRGGPVGGILGRIGTSGDILIPSFVTLENGRVYSHAMVGFWGRCLIEDIKLNGSPITDFADVVYETREGTGGEDVTFLSSKTYFMDPIARGQTLRNFTTDGSTQLTDQAVPANSKPTWQVMRTNGTADVATIRLAYPSAFQDSAGAEQGILYRIEVRKVGTVPWRRLPVLHIRDKKLSGPFRTDINIYWGKKSRQWRARGVQFNAANAYWSTAAGQPFAYDADSYFNPSTTANTDIAPVMASNVSGSIVVSASHDAANAWMALDGNTGTQWAPATSSLPAWWQIDWGAGNAKTLRRFYLESPRPWRPKAFRFSGSNDGVTWMELINVNETISSAYVAASDYNLANETAYRYYRFDITANWGDAATWIRQLEFYETNFAQILNVGTNVSGIIANYVALHEDGWDIYLDPLQGWDVGEHDIRIMRSAAFDDASFAQASYAYGGFLSTSYFFDGSPTSPYAAVKDQSIVGLAVSVEDFITVLNQPPINPLVESRLARIAVRVPDMVINSISATFTSYAREWNGSVWVDTPVPTRNPASLWRDALLRSDINASPLPGEILDEASLEAFFDHCVANGFTCDAVVRDKSIADITRLCGAVARASPRQSNMWGVVIDQDRSAEPITALLTPETSRDLGTDIAYENVPQGLRVTYLDEDDGWLPKEVEVYRPGFTAANATDVQSDVYDGITSLAKATAQASYDLAQLHFRKVLYQREVGIEARAYARGEKFGIADDVLFRHAYFGLVKTIFTSAGNVTGIEIYGLARLSESADQIGMFGDITTMGDISTATGSFGAKIRLKNGGIATVAITETTDTTTITFATPVADTGQFDLSQPVAIGPLGREVITAILHHKEQTGTDTWKLTLLPEANVIFA